MRRLSLFLMLFGCFSAFGQANDVWNDLMKGNGRYVAGHLVYAKLVQQREAVAEKQRPPVTVLSCADSRVPPELAFDHSVGDLFVVRVAGNVSDAFALASIEYAVVKGWTKVIVVMGHQRCGAVEEAVKHTPPEKLTPSLLALVDRIRASFYGSSCKDGDLDCAIQHNARTSAQSLLSSEIIRNAVHSGKLTIIPAYYSLDSGEVKRLD